MVYIPKSVIEKLNELSCEEVAEKLGIVVKYHRALCIAHDDHHPSMGRTVIVGIALLATIVAMLSNLLRPN